MQLSAKTQNACIAAMELARRFDDPQPVSLKTIADAHGLSPQFLVQILLQLKRAGVVKSIRGASGGYRLAADPDEISLLDIVSALEGQPAEFAVSSDNPVGRVISDHWTSLVAQHHERLAETTLTSLVAAIESPLADMYYI